MAKQFNKKKKEEFPEPRINDEINGNYDVRVIRTAENGETINEVMPLSKAKWLAMDVQGLDLIEINAKATPPIMRIDNYEKWLYAEKKRFKSNKSAKTELKEIQLTVNIGKNDFEIKAKKTREFIQSGDKVKVVLSLKGREKTRRDESERTLYEFLVSVSDVAIPESMPKSDGSKTVAILKRKK